MRRTRESNSERLSAHRCLWRFAIGGTQSAQEKSPGYKIPLTLILESSYISKSFNRLKTRLFRSNFLFYHIIVYEVRSMSV